MNFVLKQMYKEKSKIKKKQKEFFVKILKYIAKARKEKEKLYWLAKSSDQVEIKTRNKRMILNY